MDDFSNDGSLVGPYCVVAVTAEGEFVYSRHETHTARNKALGSALGFLDHDIDMVANGAPHTLYYADDVITFIKKDDPIDESDPGTLHAGSIPIPREKPTPRRNTRRRKNANGNS